MGYEIVDNIHKGYFRINKVKSNNLTIEYYLDKYKIDLDNYFMIKASNNFRFIELKDRLKYSAIMFFEKNKYRKKDIEMWINLLYHKLMIGNDLRYLTNPFPPVDVLNKIKVVEWDI